MIRTSKNNNNRAYCHFSKLGKHQPKSSKLNACNRRLWLKSYCKISSICNFQTFCGRILPKFAHILPIHWERKQKYSRKTLKITTDNKNKTYSRQKHTPRNIPVVPSPSPRPHNVESKYNLVAFYIMNHRGEKAQKNMETEIEKRTPRWTRRPRNLILEKLLFLEQLSHWEPTLAQPQRQE